MVYKTNRNNLGYLGEEFQFKLIHEFMDDKELFMDLSSILNQNMFTNPGLRVFVGSMKDYYEKHDVVPSYDIMKILLSDRSHNEIERETYIALTDKIIDTPSDGADYIKEMAIKFFRQQNIIKTANEILKIAGDGDITKYQDCVDLLNNAMATGVHEDLGVTVFDNIEETLSDDYRITIPTGIGKIDETLEGGLGKGELGVIVGPSSFGKSSLSTAMASYAATYRCDNNNNRGYKVLQIVFEDRIKQIQRKHIGRITGVEAKDLSKPEYIEIVREQLERFGERDTLKANLKIVRFPSGEKTADDIKRFIKKLINHGFKPDMVIIDYFETLRIVGDSSTNNEWEKEGKTMRKLESMAGEMDFALWVPVQGTRDSVNAELVTMDKAGGSFKKIQIAHIVMSIARTNEDIQDNKATIAILKNRAGKAGKVFNNVEFNNGTCRISTDNVDEIDSMFDYDKKKETDEVKLQQSIFKMVRDKKS